MKRMKRIIKRIVLYLLLGFVMSWVVAWGLAMLPRVAYAGYLSRSVVLSDPSFGVGDMVYIGDGEPPEPEPPELLTIMDSRWIGVQEVQYFVSSFNQSSSNMGMSVWISYQWWTLTINERWLVGQWRWTELKEEFKSDENGIRSTDYAILRYGFPFMSHESHAAFRRTNTPSAGWQEELVASGVLTNAVPPSISDIWSRRDRQVPFAELLYLPYSPLWRGLLYNTLFYALIFFALTSTKRAYRHARRYRKGRCPICAYDLQYDNTLGCPECGWRKASEAQV
jgi:hypothetical protein